MYFSDIYLEVLHHATERLIIFGPVQCQLNMLWAQYSPTTSPFISWFNYRRFDWVGNIHTTLIIMVALATTVTLVTMVTWSIRRNVISTSLALFTKSQIVMQYVLFVTSHIYLHVTWNLRLYGSRLVRV